MVYNLKTNDMASVNRFARYKMNKNAKCGEMIICPICGKEFKKKQYSQAFCCSTCKDKYHNDMGDRHYDGYYDLYNARHPHRLEYIDRLMENMDDSECWCENPQLGI